MSLVLVQCFPCSGEIPWSAWKHSSNFLSVQFSALKLAVGQVNAKTNLSCTAVEILKPHRILKWCHSNAVITCLPQDLLMAVEVLIHQGAPIIETIHLLYVLFLPLLWLLTALWYLPVMSCLPSNWWPVRSPENCTALLWWCIGN